ncbi:BA71V-H233R (j6R) [African swine fever virus]|uniref:BA71V-H233R (J6R) n=1 Tax=African swine fever virus TaxID=10497 RepID=A0A894ZVX3_ASF|nr:BA71V-H233R (j6R) [African swine fever virus]
MILIASPFSLAHLEYLNTWHAHIKNIAQQHGLDIKVAIVISNTHLNNFLPVSTPLNIECITFPGCGIKEIDLLWARIKLFQHYCAIGARLLWLVSADIRPSVSTWPAIADSLKKGADAVVVPYPSRWNNLIPTVIKEIVVRQKKYLVAVDAHHLDTDTQIVGAGMGCIVLTLKALMVRLSIGKQPVKILWPDLHGTAEGIPLEGVEVGWFLNAYVHKLNIRCLGRDYIAQHLN